MNIMFANFSRSDYLSPFSPFFPFNSGGWGNPVTGARPLPPKSPLATVLSLVPIMEQEQISQNCRIFAFSETLCHGFSSRWLRSSAHAFMHAHLEHGAMLCLVLKSFDALKRLYAVISVIFVDFLHELMQLPCYLIIIVLKSLTLVQSDQLPFPNQAR